MRILSNKSPSFICNSFYIPNLTQIFGFPQFFFLFRVFLFLDILEKLKKCLFLLFALMVILKTDIKQCRVLCFQPRLVYVYERTHDASTGGFCCCCDRKLKNLFFMHRRHRILYSSY